MTTGKKQRVTLFLSPNLLKQSKGQAIAEETSLAALVERALIKYLPVETIIRNTEVKADLNPSRINKDGIRRKKSAKKVERW